MQGMELYVRFMATLAGGLIGVGLVLKILLEGLFNEWDAFNDVASKMEMALSGKHHVGLIRPEDILLEAEKRNTPNVNSRLIDRRREQLKELDDVENRLNHMPSSAAVAAAEIQPS
ncbi:MAG: hypothetical protein AAB320_02260 [Elusimicrobiota bacterium]